MSEDQSQKQDPIELSSHAESYSEDSFWEKIKGYAQKIGSAGLYYALVLYYMATDDKVPLPQKAIIMGALGYLILPIDVIPDTLLGVGFTDDIGVMLTALRAVRDNISLEHLEAAEQKLREWFPNAELPSADFLK